MTDQDIVDCLARHGIGWGDENGVTAYPLDGEDAPIYIAAIRELLAAPVAEPVAVFDGYSDGGTAIIQWRGQGLPAGTLLYAAPAPGRKATPEDRYVHSLHRAVERLTAALHVATLRAHPHMTHTEIQAEIARIAAAPAPK